MSSGSSPLKSISIRIVAIAFMGAVGIAVIAGSTFYLETLNSRALKSQADATELASRTNEIDRLYAAARQDLSDFVRTRQARPADVFGERMQTIAAQASAIAALPDGQGVGAQLNQLRALAEQSGREIV